MYAELNSIEVKPGEFVKRVKEKAIGGAVVNLLTIAGKRVVVVEADGEDHIVIHPLMYMALSYDHRIVDGREAVTFLVRVKECLEDPARLVLDL